MYVKIFTSQSVAAHDGTDAMQSALKPILSPVQPKSPITHFNLASFPGLPLLFAFTIIHGNRRLSKMGEAWEHSHVSGHKVDVEVNIQTCTH